MKLSLAKIPSGRKRDLILNSVAILARIFDSERDVR
jgi:hypothetical protein